MDCFDHQTRRKVMQSVRSVDTKPELLVRSYLFRHGFRFRLHVKSLPGHPDIVLPKYKTVVEVRGCFWHRHPGCKVATTPSSNIDFWQTKFKRNIERDKRHADELNALGWKLIVVWGCETAKKRFPPTLLAEFVTAHKTKRLDNKTNG